MVLPGFSEDKQYNILILHSRSADFPWVVSVNTAFEKIREENFPHVRFYFEFMNKNFPEDHLGDGIWKTYLAGKYSELNLSLIIAEGTEAVDLMKQSTNLFPGIPKVHRGDNLIKNTWTGNRLYLTSNIANAAVSTIKLAMEQNPELKTILLINGGTQATKPVIPEVTQYLGAYPEIELDIVSDFYLKDLINTVSGMEKESIILYTLVMTDKSGTSFVPRDVLSQITAVSEVPVYTFWNSLLGTGTVGRTMLDAETVARGMYRAGIDFLKTGEYSGSYSTMATVWDWRVLKQFNLPPTGENNSYTIINKPESFFKTYKQELIVLSLIILALFSLGISFGLIKYRKISKVLSIQKDELEELTSHQSLLLKEIDHRVKNNLTLLRSLVSLQIHESSNREVKDNLQIISNRIISIKNLYEDLFRAESVNEINGKKYFTDLLTQIQEGMLMESSGIDIEMNISETRLSPKDAMYIGLMANELVTNAIKYAFPDESENGRIAVSFLEDSDGAYTLEVSDNGTGLPQDFDVTDGKGLGLKIVTQLTSQLSGELEVYRENGTRFRVKLHPKN